MAEICTPVWYHYQYGEYQYGEFCHQHGKNHFSLTRMIFKKNEKKCSNATMIPILIWQNPHVISRSGVYIYMPMRSKNIIDQYLADELLKKNIVILKLAQTINHTQER